MTFKVFSGRPEVLEAGYEPFLEAVFYDHKQAEEFVELWLDIYRSSILFWVEAS